MMLKLFINDVHVNLICPMYGKNTSCFSSSFITNILNELVLAPEMRGLIPYTNVLIIMHNINIIGEVVPQLSHNHGTTPSINVLNGGATGERELSNPMQYLLIHLPYEAKWMYHIEMIAKFIEKHDANATTMWYHGNIVGACITHYSFTLVLQLDMIRHKEIGGGPHFIACCDMQEINYYEWYFSIVIDLIPTVRAVLMLMSSTSCAEIFGCIGAILIVSSWELEISLDASSFMKVVKVIWKKETKAFYLLKLYFYFGHSIFHIIFFQTPYFIEVEVL
ncbi:hypothetical protein ACJX0J_012265 [Zea mays]